MQKFPKKRNIGIVKCARLNWNTAKIVLTFLTGVGGTGFTLPDKVKPVPPTSRKFKDNFGNIPVKSAELRNWLHS